jgi:hypothetical protein
MRTTLHRISAQLLLLLLPLAAVAALPSGIDMEVCQNEGYKITSKTDATGTSAVTYEWYENNTKVNGETGAVLTIAAGKAVAGDYKYVRKAKNASCTEIASNTITVRVKAVPVIKTQPDAQTLCGYNVPLTLSVVADPGSFHGGDITAYFWWKNRSETNVGEAVGTGNPYTTMISEGGTYTVEVDASNGCKTFSNPAVVRVAGTEVGALGSITADNCNQDAVPGALGGALSSGCNASATPGALGQ